MDWRDECLKNIQKLKNLKTIEEAKKYYCGNAHCNTKLISHHNDKMCKCEKPFEHMKVKGKCPFTNYSPIPVADKNCFCCCWCFASNTLIAINQDETKPIMELSVGDMVYVADDPSLEHWSQKPLKFSAGTGNDGSNTMLKISFEANDEEDFLLVSRDQPIFMSDRKLKQACKLVPGKDQIMMWDNTPAQVVSLSYGRFKQGLHHIATSIAPATTMNGHLIVAKGVVCADFSLQIGNITEQLDQSMIVEGHDELPEFGTKEYLEVHKHLEGNEFGVTHQLEARHKGHNVKQPEKEEFEPLGIKGPESHPDHVHYFLSKKQAFDIAKYCPGAPVGSQVGFTMVRYLFNLCSGFYPEVKFYLDEEALEPNAYSYRQCEVPFVVINGGLIRKDGMQFDSVVFVIAHELAHLYGQPPLNAQRYTCEGNSDYLAMAVIIPSIFQNLNDSSLARNAIKQIEKFFGYISPEHAKGAPGNTCMNISIKCRLKAMWAGFRLQPLPECAGGPLDPVLEVVRASAYKHNQDTYVMVSFNDPVDSSSAEEVSNYYFNPAVATYSAQVDSSDSTKVIIKADIKPNVQYVVEVINVVTERAKRGLVYDKNKAQFELN